MALAFAQEGARAVAVTYASAKAAAEQTASEVEAAGAKALVHHL